MKNENSSRHHYIPEFLIKNFTSSDNKVFVFDKEKKEILRKKKSPKQILFEWNRNTIKVGDQEDSRLEDLYTKIVDDRGGRIIRLINESDLKKFQLTPDHLIDIQIFICFMYWRLPATDDKTEEVFNRKNLDEIGLELVNLKNSDPKTKDNAKEFLFTQEFMKKYLNILLSFQTMNQIIESKNFFDWRVLYSNKKLHLTSDNPIIFASEVSTFKDINKDLIFPIGSDKTVIKCEINMKTMSANSNLLQDLVILHQAKKYVIGPDRKYLKDVVDHYYQFYEQYTDQEMRDLLFNEFKH